MREKEIEEKLRKAVKQMGGKAYKFVSPGNVGVPDRIVIMPGGRIYFVELKTASGRLTPVQQSQLVYLKNLGQDVRVLYGLSDVEDFIRELSKTGGGADEIPAT